MSGGYAQDNLIGMGQCHVPTAGLCARRSFGSLISNPGGRPSSGVLFADSLSVSNGPVLLHADNWL